MDEKILDKILKTAERFFLTANDSEQIPTSRESLQKLQKLHPKAFLYKIENGEPISWVVTLPTTNDLASEFLEGRISERQLLVMTEAQDEYDALYLCAAFTIPEFRRMGYATELFLESINAISCSEKMRLFAWIVSKEGQFLIDRLANKLNAVIEIKKGVPASLPSSESPKGL